MRTCDLPWRACRRGWILLVLPLLGACEVFQRPQLIVPTVEEAKAAYAGTSSVTDVRVSGNVVEVTVDQPAEHLRRGGSLWARLGPYVHLFSPATRSLFENFNGLAAVRVVTKSGDVEVARAMLYRDDITTIVWQRGESMLSQVLRDGTTQPAIVEEFVFWAEGIAEFEYNSRYVPQNRRSSGGA